MSKPFLSEGAYKALTVVGALMASFFCVLLSLSLWLHQKAKIQEQQILLENESKEAATMNKKQQSSLLQIHVPVMIGTLAVLLFGMAMALAWDPFLTMIIAFSGVLSLFTIFFPTTKSTDTQPAAFSRLTKFMYGMAIASAACLLIASISLASVSYKTIPYAHYTYLGRMRIVGFSVRFGTNATFGKYDGMCVEQSIPTTLLAWGGEWACPNSPNQYCEAYVDSGSSCIYSVCQESYSDMFDCSVECDADDYEAAEENTQACVENTQLYQDTMEWLEENGGTYDKDEDIEGTEGWISKNMYGDCQTCQVRIASIVDSERSQQKANGYATTIIFGTVGVISGVLWLLALLREKRQAKNGDRAVILLESGGVSA